jgi:hypothetical protein
LDPGVRLELAPEMLPGFGVHSATLTLSPGGGAVSVQWRRDGAADTETQTVLLTPATPTAELNWIATTPFQPGVVWRIADGQHAWSAPIAPQDDLVIEIPGGA